ncbi:A disintegrin and metalloproteinase with thrombospondin motifs 9-like [Haliotis cracherodii]|uniref:A disintegrin and metalloproteinase with thrombospondin motifs 9-like n=1 Tax=Haliotis cracherodii TaxID=6455 RepID=UPI0039EAA159
MEAVMGAGSILDGIFLLLVLSQHHANSTKICSKSSNFPLLQQNNKLPNHEITSMTTEGPVKCAYNCMSSKMCHSFNFDTNTGNCQLNHATLSPGGLNASYLVTTPGFVFSDISLWPKTIAGACANHNCSVNGFCEPLGKDEYTCGRLVTTPSSCAEVKECDPSSTDGEYWLRLLNFDLYRTRIYCYNMNTDTPVEYLTLPTPNYGIYPNVSNNGCYQETSLVLNCKGSGGEAFYHKIRVHIENMKVQRNDRTFADFSNQDLNYAEATDCFTIHDYGVLRSCGTRGEFTVNLTNTGWIVGPDQEWRAGGWRAIIESIERDDTGAVVHLKCGGFPGYCYPDGGLMLKPFYRTAIPDSSAREVTCPS